MSNHNERFRSRAGLLPPGFKFPGFQSLCMGGLDSSAYLSSAMGSPAVMVLTSTGGEVTPHVQAGAGGQVTFARQRLGDKDGVNTAPGGHLPFPSPPFPVRPLFGQTDPYGTLSSPLLSLHHPLLASHALSRSYLNAASAGAFRPLGGMTDDRNGFHGSAFVPAKCMKLDSSPTDLSSQHLLLPSCYPGSDGSNFQSPANSHASTGSITGGTGSFLDGKDDDHRDSDSVMDGDRDRMSETPNMSEESRSIDRSTPEERGTPKRHKKCYLDGQTPFCPICGQTLQLPELAAHFEVEVERLIDISKCISQQMEASALRTPFSSPLHMSRKDEKIKPQSRWETYQRVKGNRTTRLTGRCIIKRKKWEDPISPTSSDRVHEEAAHMIGQSLRKVHEMEPETSVDSRTTAEFNWALTTRLQAFAQLQRGLSESYGVTRKFEPPSEDENQELNVDGDDSATYGQPHYTEADVITCSTEENQDNKDQVKRLTAVEGSYQRLSDSSSWNTNGGNGNGEGPEVTSTCVSNTDASGEFSPSDNTIKSNKDNEATKGCSEDGIKCLICMEQFIKPVVSICCWHVHCEECWLKTLGAKKLCPQCNMITSPRDLRRIYL